jgi:hypothetical protein
MVEWLNKLSYMLYYEIILSQKVALWIHTTLINLQKIMLNEKGLAQQFRYCMIPIIHYQNDKIVEIENRLLIASS